MQQSSTNNNTKAYDNLFKILMIGDGGVGKSSLVLRFSEDTFDETQLQTIGVDFRTRTLVSPDTRKVVKVQIWDTAGQERFRTITSSYYRGAHGVIVVYDVTSVDSFLSVKRWLREIQTYAPERIAILLIGNKTDLDHRRTVSTKDAQAFADSLSIGFMEASAKNSTNVEAAFLKMVAAIDSKLTDSLPARPSAGTVQLQPKHVSGWGGWSTWC